MSITKELKRRRDRRVRVRRRIRKRVAGEAERPRLSVFRSNSDIYVQLIDDRAGHTLVATSSREDTLKNVKGTKSDKAQKVGELLAKKATKAGIQQVVFDRGGYLFHGRVKALADGARKGGLKF